jgi:polysaccharide pyruvyl transferase WcaK-like protein
MVLSQGDPVNSIDQLLSKVSAMDYVITCRFHGVVLAHLLNKPVLAMAHHPKVSVLMKGLGLSRYCVDIRTFDPDHLRDTFASLVRNTDEVKTRMNESLASYKSKLTIQFDHLFPSSTRATARFPWQQQSAVRW